MKLSVSLPTDDVAFLDEETRAGRYESRSAAVKAAVTVLRQAAITDSYAAAWDEWENAGDDELWDSVTADGLAAEGKPSAPKSWIPRSIAP